MFILKEVQVWLYGVFFSIFAVLLLINLVLNVHCFKAVLG